MRAWTDEQLASAFAEARSWKELCDLLEVPSGRDVSDRLIRDLAALGLEARRLDASSEEPTRLAAARRLSHLRGAGSHLVAAVLALAGYRISWRLEPAMYDLVADDGEQLNRVQVKTTANRSGGTWVCSISRGRYSGHVPARRTRAWYSPSDIDSFGIVDGDLVVYLIPAELVSGRSAIHVRKYEAHRVGRLTFPPV